MENLENMFSLHGEVALVTGASCKAEQVHVRFEILWPNGKTQTVENVEINRSMTIRFDNQP